VLRCNIVIVKGVFYVKSFEIKSMNYKSKMKICELEQEIRLFQEKCSEEHWFVKNASII
jgi:hypothetical protein